MKHIFLGRPIFWLLWVVMLFPLWIMGLIRLHVVSFNVFISVLLGLTTAGILFVVFTYRKGETITREPFENSPPPKGK